MSQVHLFLPLTLRPMSLLSNIYHHLRGVQILNFYTKLNISQLL